MIQGERATMEPKNEGSEDDLPYTPFKMGCFFQLPPVSAQGRSIPSDYMVFYGLSDSTA